MAGVDQFGGNNDIKPVLEAYKMGVEEHGKEWMEQRMRLSARRLLLNIFRTGLFENPYLDPAETAKTVGSPKYMEEGYKAQLQSVVMLKNSNGLLPLKGRKKAYIPQRYCPEYKNFWGAKVPESLLYPVSKKLGSNYFDMVESPAEADVAILFIESPKGGWGYSLDDVKSGGNGYLPISLQYNDYTATEARAESMAGGDPFENFTNRSYKGKSTTTVNKCDMELVVSTKKAMGNKPVIVAIKISNPMVMSEIEPFADALFVTFDVQNQAVLDLVTGRAEPSGLLPFQMPADMETVEAQAEDTPRDMRCHIDNQGNTYDFAFGLNWKGVISDERVLKYR